MQEWLNVTDTEVILFWPPPLNSDLLIGPALISGKTDYIRLIYGDQDALSPETFTMYISEGVDFKRNEADTISRLEKVIIAGNPVDVEILTRSMLPEQGIAVFQIDNTNVVIQWFGVNEQTILDLLKENIKHLSDSDLD